ncbi:MAG TPA: FtsK/SpoIIIE domain-containing protein [Acidimicrobiales bacterium]|nr:FtsK/SpoIIIE domain-containing protein [Acidimicrobiales bacterium]
MDLLLELTFPTPAGGHSADVAVEIDPDDTVDSLASALAGYAARRGYADPPTGRSLVREVTGRALDPGRRVMDTGLVSGETVRLSADEPAAPGRFPAPEGLSLDITAGPEAGRLIPLRPGAVIVGRASTCRVAIDDPTLSREHFAVVVSAEGRRHHGAAGGGRAGVSPEGQVTIIANPEATNGTLVEGERLDDPREVEPGELIEAGASVFVVRAAATDETRRRDRMGQVPFNRVPYRRTIVVPRALPELPRPPETSAARKLSIAAAMMPAGSAVMMVVMTQRYQFLAMAALSPLLLIYRHFSDKRGGKRKFRREKAEYLEQVEIRAAEVDQALDDERRTRLAAAPDLAELAHQATQHMPRLWERDREAGDLLDLRLGLGEVPSQVVAAIASGGDGELHADGTEQLAHHTVVPDAPITVNVAEAGIVGLWGDPDQVGTVGRSMVAQAACLHSPEDLVIAAGLGVTSLRGFEWLKWLPHVRSATSPLEGDHLAVGADDTRRLLAQLLAVAADRGDRSGLNRSPSLWPRVLVLLDEAAEVDRSLLSQLLDVAPAYGIHVLWLGENGLQMPRQCRAVVACPGHGAAGRVGFTDPSLADRVVELDGTSPATATAIARALAPLRDASAGSQTTAIPRVVPLLDAVGIDRPAGDVIAARWEGPREYSLEFPIGLSAEGTFRLDLVEQGPHTLIGGTSGAGKSELLQTLVLSLAANYPPDQLNFLFVDYKGGASSAEFRDLPHTVGYVTNLNGRMSLRALTSLRAELQRRMSLLEGKAKDLREMLTVAPEEAPPSLVIVVDEFAALVKEIPDFVAGIVDIAQRGRSLGVHLILATQRPTGVVNDNILANTNLRISLRMLDPADSNNVIGTRDAAEIPVPLRGRAYARTGPTSLVPFQCAWSGAPYATDAALRHATVRSFTLGSSLSPLGDDEPDGRGAATATATGGGADAPEPPTHLEVLVDACAAAARALQLPPVRRPWVEPLGDVIGLGRVLERMKPGELRADPGRLAVLGMYDDPQNQAQHVSVVDLEATGGLIVFGTGGSGKTTLLRTVAAALATQGDPDEVQIYALDFASRGLEPLADLPHCGAVVAGDDVEQVTRLLTVLNHEIEQRRVELAAARAENLGALRQRTGTAAFPRIVVLLDGYSGFHSTFDRADRYPWLTALQRIVSNGRQVGVHCVLTTDRRMGVPNALLSAISARCALRMATHDELSALGVPAKVAKDAELPNGRGFVDGTTEVQVACVSDDPSGVAQAEAIAALADKLAASADARTPAVPVLPDAVVLDREASRPLTAPLGLVDLSLDVVEVDLVRQNLVVMGPPLSGKSTALETVALGLRASSPRGLQLVALGTSASPLSALDIWDDAAFARAGQAGLVERLADDLAADEGVDARTVLFVDAGEDIEGNDVLRTLETLTRSDALRFVVAGEVTTIAKAYSGWLAALRRNRSALVLQPESKIDVENAVGFKPDLRPDQPFPPGRGVYVANRRWQLVQVGQRGRGTA